MKPGVPVEKKRCRECRQWLTVFAFRKDATGDLGRRGVCKRCEITARTESKKVLSLEQRFLEKIRRTAVSHANRLKLTLAEFLNRHPWELPWMARDAAVLYQHGYCPRCHVQKFSDLGLHDFTLDIIFKELLEYSNQTPLVLS